MNRAGIKSMLKILTEFLKYFSQNSSIHGLKHIADEIHPAGKFLWLVLVASAVYGAVLFSGLTVTRYRENPTVISMERDRFSWNTSFPATTICPSEKLNEKLLDSFLDNSTEIKNKTLYREFIISLSAATYTNFDKVVQYGDVQGEDFMDLLVKFQFEFQPSVTSSGLMGEQYNLQQTITEVGICYSFNSNLAVYNSPSFWKQDSWKLLPENETLSVNPLDGEVFVNVVNISSGYQVYIHGPYEVVDIASKYLRSQHGYFLQLYLSALTLFSGKHTKGLMVNQRKCRFHYESNLKYSPAYSYVLCRMECRANLAKQLCGCVPHFYRKLDGIRICNVSGLHCLSRYKERLILLRGECSCLANCDEVTYVVDDMDYREWFLGTILQWGLKDYPKMRLRRDVIFGFSDLLVYIGGMAGLFLGCSVLSFIEIIFFVTIRFYWFVINFGKETRERFH